MFELVLFAFLPFFYMFGMLLISTFVLWLIMKILKKIKIYFNRDNPYESETKAEHNKYLKTALFIGTIITLTLVLIKFSLT